MSIFTKIKEALKPEKKKEEPKQVKKMATIVEDDPMDLFPNHNEDVETTQ